MHVDLHEFTIQSHYSIAPLLDVYEQALYLCLFRHSRLIGKEQVLMGFKPARSRLATGVGEGGRPMSESTNQKKLFSLQEKGLITIIRTTHKERVFKVHLPSEISELVIPADAAPAPDPETINFFAVSEHRQMLLEREGYQCFYTLKPLTKDSFVVEHVVSRPNGDNSYRSCVAASREVNNKKGASSAKDFLRRLLREGYLNDTEFEDRMQALERLKSGGLRPKHLSFPTEISNLISPDSPEQI